MSNMFPRTKKYANLLSAFFSTKKLITRKYCQNLLVMNYFECILNAGEVWQKKNDF